MNCRALIKAIDAYIKKAEDKLEDELKEAGYVDPEETVNELNQLEERVANALKESNDMLLDSIQDAEDLQVYADTVWPQYRSEDDLAKKLQRIFQEELSEYVPGLVEQYTKQIDPELMVTEISMRTTAWIESWSEELGQIMQLSSYNEIESILAKNLKDGKGIAEFTRSLMDSGVRDEYYKARRASITEVLTAHSVAREEALLQNPAVEEKEWTHTGAHQIEPRQNHIDMDGQIVKKEEPFVLVGEDGATYYPMYPRDPILPAGERINCHCIHRGIVNEDVLGLSLGERQQLQAEAIAEDNGEWEKELDAKNKAKAGIE